MEAIERIPQILSVTRRSWQVYLVDTVLAAGGALLVTALIYLAHLYPTIPNISITYLLVILLLASTRGRYGALVAAITAFLSFDFFLIPPLYTFTIASGEEWLALFIFLAVALFASQLTATIQKSTEDARLREREARILYELGRVANSTESIEDRLDIIALSTVRVFSPWGVRECALLVPDSVGNLQVRSDAPIRVEDFTLSLDEMKAAMLVMKQGEMIDLHHLGTTPNVLLRLLPLKVANEVLGVLCLRIEDDGSRFANKQYLYMEPAQSTAQATFFWTFLDQATAILERIRLLDKVKTNTI